MTAFPRPVVATAGSTDPAAPLVVLLRGRGSNERDIIGLADRLPDGPAYAALRAPIAEGGGYAWFANRGIGRPVGEALHEAMDWFRGWLDAVAPVGRSVVSIGFSGGAAFAGGLLLDDVARYAVAAVLYGTLPFDAGVPTTTARLAGVPVVVAQGEQDTVIPRPDLGLPSGGLGRHDDVAAPPRRARHLPRRSGRRERLARPAARSGALMDLGLAGRVAVVTAASKGLGRATALALVVAFLCSQQAAFVNGTTLGVDGAAVDGLL